MIPQSVTCSSFLTVSGVGNEEVLFFYQQAAGERNYHIFYEMLCGLTDEQKQKLSLTSAEDFAYLNQVSFGCRCSSVCQV